MGHQFVEIIVYKTASIAYFYGIFYSIYTIEYCKSIIFRIESLEKVN